MTIEAKRLFDIVRSLPDDDVHITMQENNSLLVESGTAKFRLLGLPAEDEALWQFPRGRQQLVTGGFIGVGRPHHRYCASL